MQDVERGVVVSVEDKTAFRTPMHTYTEVFMRTTTTAARAKLRRAMRVYCHNLTTGAFSLVSKEHEQLGPGGIHHTLGEVGFSEREDV